MERNGNPIHHYVGQGIPHGEHIELIDVVKEGEPIVLLRTTKMPEYAFVLWVSYHSGTASQLALQGGHREKHSVVCACCPSETYSIDHPEFENDEAEGVWRREKAEEFKQALLSTCKEHGITTIFMRRAGSWDRHYGRVDGFKVVEAARHRSAMLDEYGRNPVHRALLFIDYEWSDYLHSR